MSTEPSSEDAINILSYIGSETPAKSPPPPAEHPEPPPVQDFYEGADELHRMISELGRGDIVPKSKLLTGALKQVMLYEKPKDVQTRWLFIPHGDQTIILKRRYRLAMSEVAFLDDAKAGVDLAEAYVLIAKGMISGRSEFKPDRIQNGFRVVCDGSSLEPHTLDVLSGFQEEGRGVPGTITSRFILDGDVGQNSTDTFINRARAYDTFLPIIWVLGYQSPNASPAR